MIPLLILVLIVAILLTWLIVKTLVGLVLMLVIAGLASAAAQSFFSYRGGFSFTLISGLAGGLLGIILAKALNVPGWLTWPEIGRLPVLWTLIGALIVVGVAKISEPIRRLRTPAGHRRF